MGVLVYLDLGAPDLVHNVVIVVVQIGIAILYNQRWNVGVRARLGWLGLAGLDHDVVFGLQD